MKTTDRLTMALALCLSMGAASCAVAEADARGSGRDEHRQFREEQRQRRREHFETQHAENEAFHEQQRGKEPQAACLAAKAHRQQQHEENVAFFAQQHARLVAHINEWFAEHGDAERQQQILQEAEERYGRIRDHYTQQHAETMALLTNLAGQADLTREAMREALRPHIQQQRQENREFWEALRDESGGRRGQEGGHQRRGRNVDA